MGRVKLQRKVRSLPHLRASGQRKSRGVHRTPDTFNGGNRTGNQKGSELWEGTGSIPIGGISLFASHLASLLRGTARMQLAQRTSASAHLLCRRRQAPAKHCASSTADSSRHYSSVFTVMPALQNFVIEMLIQSSPVFCLQFCNERFKKQFNFNTNCM